MAKEQKTKEKEPVQQPGMNSGKYGLTKGKHGVIVVHGIGEQKKGETIADFANSLALSLIESKDGGTVHVNANLDGDPASVTLHITEAGTGVEADWICKEGFWADAFQPPPAREVIKLVVFKHVRVIFRHLLALMGSLGKVIKDPFNNGYGLDIEGKVLKASDERFKLRNDSISGWLASLGHLIIAVLLPFIGMLGYLLLLLYWLIGWAAGVSNLMPILKPLDTAVGWLHKNVDPFLSKSVGDLSQYFEHTVWAASIRHRLETSIIDMLDEKNNIDDITIVAHSMGCLVSYEVLSKGGEVAKKVAEQSAKGRNTKITFVSFGSAINLGFDMVRQPDVSLEAKERIDHPFAPEITDRQDKFFWLDMHSRLDPVPAGFPSAILRSENKLEAQQFEHRRVVNNDDLFMDHPAYWHNKELVMVRIAKAINGGTYPWASLEPTREKLVKRVRSEATWVIFRGIAVVLAVLAIAAALIWHPPWLSLIWLHQQWLWKGIAIVLAGDVITLIVAGALSRY